MFAYMIPQLVGISNIHTYLCTYLPLSLRDSTYISKTYSVLKCRTYRFIKLHVFSCKWRPCIDNHEALDGCRCKVSWPYIYSHEALHGYRCKVSWLYIYSHEALHGCRRKAMRPYIYMSLDCSMKQLTL